MASLWLPLLMLVLAIPLVLQIVRANELFVLRYRNGRLRGVRGRIPPTLFSDIEDVLRARRSGSDQPIVLRGVVEDRRLRFYADGDVDDGQRQQLRNLAGGWPVAKIRAARKVR